MSRPGPAPTGMRAIVALLLLAPALALTPAAAATQACTPLVEIVCIDPEGSSHACVPALYASACATYWQGAVETCVYASGCVVATHTLGNTTRLCTVGACYHATADASGTGAHVYTRGYCIVACTPTPYVDARSEDVSAGTPAACLAMPVLVGTRCGWLVAGADETTLTATCLLGPAPLMYVCGPSARADASGDASLTLACAGARLPFFGEATRCAVVL